MPFGLHRLLPILAAVALLAAAAASRPGAPPLIEILAAPDRWDDAGGIEARTIQLVDGARQTLHGALYELSLPAVAAALCRARARGVDVRLHLESDNCRARREQQCLRLLDAAGIPLTGDFKASLMHDKFLVIDRQIVWTGSANLAWTGCHLHYDEAVILRSRALAARYESALAALSHGDPPADDAAPVAVGDALVRTGFAPGPARARLFLEAIRAARRRLWVAAFSLTWAPLVDALAARARQGLAVEVMLDRRLSHGMRARQAASRLERAGCRVRFGSRQPTRDLLQRFGLPALEDVKLHHKLLAADDDVVVTGSANLSTNGMENNDENVLWIQSRAVSQAYHRILEKVLAATSDN